MGQIISLKRVRAARSITPERRKPAAKIPERIVFRVPANAAEIKSTALWNEYVGRVQVWQDFPSPLSLGRMIVALARFYAEFLPDPDAQARAMIDTIARVLPEAAARGVEIRPLGVADEP